MKTEHSAITRVQLVKETLMARSAVEDLERRLEDGSSAALVAMACRMLAVTAADIRELGGRLAGEEELAAAVTKEPV